MHYDNFCIQCCCVLWASTHVKCGSRWRKIYRRCEGRSILHTWCVIWTMTVKNILAKYVHILNFYKEFLCLRKLLHLCLNKTYLGIIDTLSHFFIILNFPLLLSPNISRVIEMYIQGRTQDFRKGGGGAEIRQRS